MEELTRLTDDKEDLRDFYALYLYCFKGCDSKVRQNYFDYRYSHSLKYGVKQNEKLKSGLLSIPLEVNFHDVNYKMNGICDVATYPEHSGHGEISRLMKFALKEMYDDRVALSYLAPFSYKFYRKFGYEAAFDHCHYLVENRDLPKIKVEDETGTIERFEFGKAITILKPLYDESVKNRLGGLIRSVWWWNYLTIKHQDWKVAIYFDGAIKARGYLIYSDDEKTFRIQDFCSTDWTSFQHLTRFITQHQSMYQFFEYESSCPIAYLDILPEVSTVQAVIRPYMMARIVNLSAFVMQYPFLKDVESVELSVNDNILPENNGIWILSVKNGEVDFKKIRNETGGDIELEFSIQSLAQAFLGYCSLDYLVRTGKLRGKKAAVNKLSKSLMDKKPQIQDYF